MHGVNVGMFLEILLRVDVAYFNFSSFQGPSSRFWLDTSFDCKQHTCSLPIIFHQVELSGIPRQRCKIILHDIFILTDCNDRNSLFQRCQSRQANTTIRDNKT